MKVLKKLIEYKKQRRISVLINVVEKSGHGPANIGARMLLTDDGKRFGTVGGGELEFKALKKAEDMIDKQIGHLLCEYILGDGICREKGEHTGMVCGGRVTLYFEKFDSCPSVYIYGGGHIGEALEYMLSKLEFDVAVVDGREAYRKRFEDRIRIFSDYDAVLNDSGIAGSYHVIASHSHELDYKILSMLLREDFDAKYIGLIASKKKKKTIYDRLEREQPGFDKSKLFCPIGLNIGGNTPYEIALSIASQIQAVKNDRLGAQWE